MESQFAQILSIQGYITRITSDGKGGAIIVWGDKRNGSYYDIYGQRINGSGTVLWQNNGRLIATTKYTSWDFDVISDGSGGTIIAWVDKPSSYQDIFAQRIDPNMTSDGQYGAIITWGDYRSGSNYDIYAQKISTAEVYNCTKVKTNKGQWISGTHEDLHVDDGNYYVIESNTKDRIQWLAWTKISENRNDVAKLTIKLDSHYSTTLYLVISIYNFSTSSWEKLGKAPGLEADYTKTWEITNPVNYVSENGEIEIRVKASTSSKFYAYLDYLAFIIETTAQTNKRLSGIQSKDNKTITGIFSLGASYPNPTRSGEVRIPFTIPKQTDISLKIYNISGQLVQTLASGTTSPGNYVISWDGRDQIGRKVQSGLYFYYLESKNFTASNPLIIVR